MSFVVDKIKLTEDWQREILVRDQERDECLLAALMANPLAIPSLQIFEDEKMNAEAGLQRLADLMFSPGTQYGEERRRKLLAAWPTVSGDVVRLLRREIRIRRDALHA